MPPQEEPQKRGERRGSLVSITSLRLGVKMRNLRVSRGEEVSNSNCSRNIIKFNGRPFTEKRGDCSITFAPDHSCSAQVAFDSFAYDTWFNENMGKCTFSRKTSKAPFCCPTALCSKRLPLACHNLLGSPLPRIRVWIYVNADQGSEDNASSRQASSQNPIQDIQHF